MSDLFVSIGTGPGMGISTAERFARGGFDLILTSRNVFKIGPFTEKIQKESGRTVETITLDATNSSAVQQLADTPGSPLGQSGVPASQ
jgi:short-subunit dehydrogenase